MANRYRGHWIDPRASELRDGFGWTAEVYIAWDEGPDTIDSRFILKEKFPTEEAALGAAIQMGKRQVDKQIESREIQSVFHQSVALPSTHQHGFGGESDDIAEGPDGLPTRVHTPDNRENRFE